MVQIARNYTDALALVSSKPNASFVATADGKGIREKKLSDSLKSFGAFFAFRYKDNLKERDSKVAQALINLYQSSNPSAGSVGPEGNQQLRRYFDAFKAEAPGLKSRSAVRQGDTGKNTKAAQLFARGVGGPVSTKSVTSNIFDGKPRQLTVPFSAQDQAKIFHEFETLASSTDPIGGSILPQHGLTAQYDRDANRQINIFEDASGTTTHGRSESNAGAVEALKKFAGSEPAARALSAIANQGSLGVIWQTAVNNIQPGQQVDVVPESKAQIQEHKLKRLDNGNVQYSLNYLTGLKLLQSRFPNDGAVEFREWPPGKLPTESDFDQKVGISFELDAKALERGELKILSHEPINYQLNIAPPN